MTDRSKTKFFAKSHTHNKTNKTGGKNNKALGLFKHCSDQKAKSNKKDRRKTREKQQMICSDVGMPETTSKNEPKRGEQNQKKNNKLTNARQQAKSARIFVCETTKKRRTVLHTKTNQQTKRRKRKRLFKTTRSVVRTKAQNNKEDKTNAGPSFSLTEQPQHNSWPRDSKIDASMLPNESSLLAQTKMSILLLHTLDQKPDNQQRIPTQEATAAKDNHAHAQARRKAQHRDHRQGACHALREQHGQKH